MSVLVKAFLFPENSHSFYYSIFLFNSFYWLLGASVRHSAHGKSHEEGGSTYAKAGSSLRSPPGNPRASTPITRELTTNCSHWRLCQTRALFHPLSVPSCSGAVSDIMKLEEIVVDICQKRFILVVVF